MKRGILLTVCAALCGCANLEQTTVYYVPTEARFYPPLAKDAVVPLLAAPPSWKYHVIGRFDMQTDRGAKFARQALLFNARRQGADAVVMRNLDYDLRRTYNRIPPSWTSVPVTNYYYQNVQDKHGRWVSIAQPYTTFIPMYRPGGVVVDDVLWTRVRADMVVRRGKKPLTVPLPSQMEMP